MWVGIGVGIGRNRFATGIFNAYAMRVTADGGITEAGQCVDAVTGLLLNASLLLIPSGYKGGKLYAEIPTNGNGDLTWTRASTAIRTNSSGLLESMATGVPRLSYMYGSCPSVLLEPQRTNLCLHSQNFADSSWVALNSTKVSTTQTDPSATNTAVNVTWSSGGSKYFYRSQSGLTIGTTYTLSFYVKSSNASKFRIYAESLGFTTSNLTSTSDFARYTLTFTATATSGTIGLQNASDNTAADLIVAFAQLEAGAYPTTYIPTTSATATRVADSFSRNNIYTNGLITSSGGTWFVELRGNVNYIRDGYAAGLLIADNAMSGGISGNGLQIRLPATTSQRLSIQKIISGTNTQLYLTTTDTTKIAIKWNGSTADVFVNGTKVVSATSFAITNMELLNGSASDIPKFIQQMALYPSPLSDTDCTTLTTL